MTPIRDVFGNPIPAHELFRHLWGSHTFQEYGRFLHDLLPWDYFVTLTFKKSILPYRAWEEVEIWLRNIQKTTQCRVHAVIAMDLKQPDNPHFHALLTGFGRPGNDFLDSTWRSRPYRMSEKMRRNLPRDFDLPYVRGHAHIRVFDPDRNGAWYIANLAVNYHGELRFYGKIHQHIKSTIESQSLNTTGTTKPLPRVKKVSEVQRPSLPAFEPREPEHTEHFPHVRLQLVHDWLTDSRTKGITYFEVHGDHDVWIVHVEFDRKQDQTMKDFDALLSGRKKVWDDPTEEGLLDERCWFSKDTVQPHYLLQVQGIDPAKIVTPSRKKIA